MKPLVIGEGEGPGQTARASGVGGPAAAPRLQWVVGKRAGGGGSFMGDLTPERGHAWGKTRIGTPPTLRHAGPPSNGFDATAESPRAQPGVREPGRSIRYGS
jgi:hypothetical protein